MPEIGDYAKYENPDWAEIVRRDPEDARAWERLAVGKVHVGMIPGPTLHLEEAIRDYTKAIELQPEWSEPYAGRSMARLWAGDVRGALEDCRNYLRTAPESCKASGHADCAEILWILGDLEGALDELEIAERSGWKHTDMRAWIFFCLGKYEDALKILKAFPAEYVGEADFLKWTIQRRLGVDGADFDLRGAPSMGMWCGLWPYIPDYLRDDLLDPNPKSRHVWETIYDKVPPTAVLYFLGCKALHLGDEDGASALWEQAMNAQPWDHYRLFAEADLGRLPRKK